MGKVWNFKPKCEVASSIIDESSKGVAVMDLVEVTKQLWKFQIVMWLTTVSKEEEIKKDGVKGNALFVLPILGDWLYMTKLSLSVIANDMHGIYINVVSQI